ncbi:hypothetical protein [Streptococcus suis]|uniref:hypothetical protein n=1 Tax=Streptococcus suis TaxID=1307 RepID=UPI001ABE45B3|nr:hypothetical protein [Streptococcus suis]
MNKRMKKKRWLEIKLAGCLAREHLLMSIVTGQNDRISEQAKEIAELRELVERNAQATNSEITTITLDTTKLAECVGRLESENKTMRVNLDKAIVDFNKPKKKSFF